MRGEMCEEAEVVVDKEKAETQGDVGPKGQVDRDHAHRGCQVLWNLATGFGGLAATRGPHRRARLS